MPTDPPMSAQGHGWAKPMVLVPGVLGQLGFCCFNW